MLVGEEGWQMCGPVGRFTNRQISFKTIAVIYENKRFSYYLIKHLKAEYNTLIYALTTSRTHPTCVISISSVNVLAPEAGDFVQLFLLKRKPIFYNPNREGLFINLSFTLLTYSMEQSPS